MGKTIIITEDSLNSLKENFEVTEFKFYGSIKKFLHDLLQNPVNAQPNALLKANDLDRVRLITLLKKENILTKKQKIVDTDENGNPTTARMSVEYKVPKQDFDKKLKRLYIKLFEKNVPEKKTPVDETTTTSVGNYAYDVPFPVKKDDPTMKRNNGVNGSNSINIVDECCAGGAAGCGCAMGGDGAGATGCSGDGAGQFITPMADVQRRDILPAKRGKKKDLSSINGKEIKA